MEALETPKRKRGRPKGSLNKATIARMSEPEAPEEPEPEPEPEIPPDFRLNVEFDPSEPEPPEPLQPPPKNAKTKQAPEPPIPPEPPVLSTKRRARKITMASAPPSTPEPLTSDTFLEHLTKGLRSARELEASKRNAHYESFFQGFPMRS